MMRNLRSIPELLKDWMIRVEMDRDYYPVIGIPFKSRTIPCPPVDIYHVHVMPGGSQGIAYFFTAMDGIEDKEVHFIVQIRANAFLAFFAIRSASSGSDPIGSAYTRGISLPFIAKVP